MGCYREFLAFRSQSVPVATNFEDDQVQRDVAVRLRRVRGKNEERPLVAKGAGGWVESGVIGGRWASDRKRMEGWGRERRGNEAEGETNETDRARKKRERKREVEKWRKKGR